MEKSYTAILYKNPITNMIMAALFPSWTCFILIQKYDFQNNKPQIMKQVYYNEFCSFVDRGFPFS